MKARTEGVEGVRVVNVHHASRVAAISSPAGPTRLLDAGLVDVLEAAGAEVDVVDVAGPNGALGAVAASFAVADRVARTVRRAGEKGRLALVLSGSCHVGLGSLAGVAGDRRGVVWLDAHGDFNTPETTTSGLVDGTTLASITGRCWVRMCEGVAGFAPVPDRNVVLAGVRALDGPEAELLEASGIETIPAGDVTAEAPGALEALGERTDGVYIHVDLDVLDTSVGRANRWATEGGLSTQELAELLAAALAACSVGAVGFASYDPSVDDDRAVAEAAVSVAARLAGGR